MSDQRGKPDKPVSVAQIAADDRLLDALGRGEPFDGDPAADPAAAMLAAWRADLDGDDLDATLGGAAWDDLPDGDGEYHLDEPEPVVVPAGDPRRKRRLVQAILGAAAAAVVAVGLAVSAHQAQPGSVLWPVSKVVYPQRAEVKAAEKAIADARAALAEGRTADAAALLTVARQHITRIEDRGTAARLQAEVDALLRALNAAVAPPPASTPTPSAPPPTAPAPRTSQSAPGGSSGAEPTAPPEGGDAPEPEPSQSSGGLLPDLPLPTPLLPLPPLPLPTLPPILPGGD